jgi:hypothetical protein
MCIDVHAAPLTILPQDLHPSHAHYLNVPQPVLSLVLLHSYCHSTCIIIESLSELFMSTNESASSEVERKKDHVFCCVGHKAAPSRPHVHHENVLA